MKYLRSKFNLLTLGFTIYLVLTAIMLLQHEIWRDEGQAWQIAKNSNTLWELFNNIRYEGHPGLWYLIIYLLAKLGLPVISMGILHSLLSSLAILILFKYSRFSVWLKLGLAFSYFFFYEYNIFARNYVFFILFLFIIAQIFSERFSKYYLVYAFSVFLLANSSLFGLVVVASLVLFEIILLFKNKSKLPRKMIIVLLIMVLACILSLWQIWPPADTGLYQSINTSLDSDHLTFIPWLLFKVFSLLDNNIYGEVGILNNSILGLVAGSLIYIMCLFTLKTSKRALLLFVIFSLAAFALFFLKFPGTLRHWGLIWVFYIFCLWLAQADKAQKNMFNLNKLAKIFLVIVLISHVFISATSFAREVFGYNSAGKQTAEYINEHELQSADNFLAGYPSYIVTSIIPYLINTNSKIYTLETQQPVAYVKWDVNYTQNSKLSLLEIISRFSSAFQTGNFQAGYLVLNFFPNEDLLKQNFELVKYYDQAVKGDEIMYIFKYLPHSG